MQYSQIFSRDHWIAILNNVIDDVEVIFTRGISSKLKSELISQLVCTHAQKYFCNIYPEQVKAAISDNDPDLLFGNIPLEIKVAKYYQTVVWRGGSYSKREGDFVFITWRYSSTKENAFEFAVYKINLNKSEWTESTHSSYYATGCTMKQVVQNPNMICILGDVIYSKRNNPKPVFEEI